MGDPGFYRQLTRTSAGITLVATFAIACPSPTQATLPRFQKPTILAQANTNPARPDIAYTLGGGDRIRLDIFEVPQYSGEYQILADGSLSLPLIGTLSVQGLTVPQATNAISSAYFRFLKRPIISISVLSPRPINVRVGGEVTRPGGFTIPLIAGVGSVPGFQYPTVTQAIEQAQGITLTADIRKVQVRRKLASGSEQVINLNLWDLIQTGDSSQDLNLRDGDTVFIPTTTTINLDEVRQIATTRFSPPLEEPRSVAVVGEVNRPGTYVVIGGKTTLEQRTLGLPTVTRAIDLAGGIKPLADIRRIQLRRLTKAGTEQIIDLNLWQLLQAGDFSQDTLLQDGDTIFIPTASAVNPAEISELATTSFSPSTIKVSVVGEVKSPGVVQVAPNTTLNQALLTAGGFNDARANRKAVDLIRLNPDGTVSKSKVNIDLTQGINEANNPLLRNNDIIVVSRSGSAKTSDSVRTFLEPIEKVFTFFNIFNLFGILGNND